MPERYVGETLGKYQIEAVVGTGGFAWVYRAFDPDLEIPVALKVLKPQYAGDETFESRFRREASTAAKLRHPNIIKIFAVGKERGAVYFAMDYLPHGLADRLDVMAVLPEPMLIRLGIDVARALGYAHREGVVHRDIKTDNILFDDHGNAVVADFGIARAVVNHAKQTGTNMVVGTPQYFAPEQARGQVLDGRADIYALGVTLYRAATGALPFNGDDWYEIARQHVETKPEKPRTLNATLSRDLQHVIMRCLEKEPAERYATGEELAEALEAIQYERGPSTGSRTQIMAPLEPASGPTDPLAPARPRRSAPRPWRTAAAVALAVGGLAAAGFVISNRTAAAPPPGARTDSLASTATPLGSPDTTAMHSTPGGVTMAGVTVPVTGAAAAPGSTLAPLPIEARRTLEVVGPPGSTIFLNGQKVGSGRWSQDTLRPMQYSVAAALPNQTGCRTARITQRVTLSAAEPRVLRLSPRPCWPVMFTITPANAARAEFVFTPVDSGVAITGRNGGPVPTVPEGAYHLRLNAPGCELWETDVRVAREEASRSFRVRMICDGD